jgi:hypothetical protein
MCGTNRIQRLAEEKLRASGSWTTFRVPCANQWGYDYQHEQGIQTVSQDEIPQMARLFRAAHCLGKRESVETCPKEA